MDWKIYPINKFGLFQQDWDRLNSNNGNTPLLDSRFIEPLLEYFGTGKEKLAICNIAGSVCCMTIIAKVRFGTWQTFQPSQGPIGCWLQSAGLSTEQLSRTLQRKLPWTGSLLGITQQDPSLLPRPEHTKFSSTVDYIDTARVTTDDTFQNYWAKRSKNLRQNLRRQRYRLSRENVEVKLVVVRDAESIHSAVEAYGVIESAGWKSVLGTAIHIDNPQGHFYETMLHNFAQTGQAIVFQYYYDNDLVATDLCIMGGGSLIILKTTYDESVTTSSPAMLMLEEAFNVIFTMKLVDNIEFYGKIMDWHMKWADNFRTMYHINVYSNLGSAINLVRQRSRRSKGVSGS
jgi:GNAT acetyltransferase-like protein